MIDTLSRRPGAGVIRWTSAWIFLPFLASVGCSDDAATTGTGAGTGTGGSSTTGQGGGSGGSTTGSGGTGTGGGAPCPGGQELCNGQCTPTVVDPNNCGGCGLMCPAGEVCFSNGCAATCPPTLSECAGTCVNMDADPHNCGACGMQCPTGQGCVQGGCVDAIPVGPPPAMCVNGGPPIELGGGTEPVCTGNAASGFSFGLCSCNDVGVPSISSAFSIDAFDSSVDPYLPGGLGGSLGANGGVHMTSSFDVSGDLRTSAGQGLTVAGDTNVQQALHVGQALDLQSPLDVTLDAFVGGPFSGGAASTVGGTLHTPSCAAVPGNLSSTACVDQAVTVPSPCDCASGSLLPLDAIVAFYADPTHNHNSQIALDQDALAGPGNPQALVLPCGIYYLSRIDPGNPITIYVEGHTAIIIGGSVEIGSAVTFMLSPTSTLDVVVGGTVHATASFDVGSPAYPAKSRFYVAGTCAADGGACESAADCCSLQCSAGQCQGDGDAGPPFSVFLTSNTNLNGGFYAPFGRFISTSNLEMFGALFLGWYDAESETTIHYDRAFIQEGEDCPGDGCGDCSDCGGQACVNGECGQCTNDGQCCPPLYCLNGECVHTPIPQ